MGSPNKSSPALNDSRAGKDWSQQGQYRAKNLTGSLHSRQVRLSSTASPTNSVMQSQARSHTERAHSTAGRNEDFVPNSIPNSFSYLTIDRGGLGHWKASSKTDRPREFSVDLQRKCQMSLPDFPIRPQCEKGGVSIALVALIAYQPPCFSEFNEPILLWGRLGRYTWIAHDFCKESHFGGELDSTGCLQCWWRAVVDQWATLKADHNFMC